jgi:hypothetical protein
VASTWPSEIPLASLLVYSPRGQTEISLRSRRVCHGIKRGDTDLLKKAVEAIGKVFAESGLGAFLGPDVGLVPAPGSAPHVAGGLWPADVIARALVDAGYGKEVLHHLRRKEAVPKSAFAAPGERPNVERHFETIAAERDFVSPQRLTIVDDVVTKGRTLLACSGRLQEAFPQADVRCLAIIRTMGLQLDVDRVLFPCTGRILWNGSDADRQP